MSIPLGPLIDPAETVGFAIWSDNPLAAEELQSRLQGLGHSAIAVNADLPHKAGCLAVVSQKRTLSALDLATWISLANKAAIDIAVYHIAEPPNQAQSWAGRMTLSWSGQFTDLDELATAIVDLVDNAGRHFKSLPTLFPTDYLSLPGVKVSSTREALMEELIGPVGSRIVPVSTDLCHKLTQPHLVISRQDYHLTRLAQWSSEPHSSAFVHRRIGRPNELSSPRSAARSIDEVIYDPLTSRLVLLLGEPGSGKTLQLKYFDALAAQRSLRHPDDVRGVTSFYIPLADQPAQPNISIGWLAERWRRSVDVQKWYTFEQFLADGGTVLLDGLNEGGMRALPLDQWMLQWRDVIQELFEKGAARVVVTCRTRDQLIPLRAPRGEMPTIVTVLPLTQSEVVAIATHGNPGAGRRLSGAITNDSGLADLYSSPFRLHAYLESGVSTVATNGARLFGLQISAAILRERDQLNFHGNLIPGRVAAELARIQASGDVDPWPMLGEIPLVRSLGSLAKSLSFPLVPGGRARLTMPQNEAAAVLSAVLPQAPELALETAKDLYILVEEGAQIRFAHPTLLHLFAAFGCTVDEIVVLAEDEQRRRREGLSTSFPNPDLLPPPMTAPSYADNRYEEVFEFSAQLRGIVVPDSLLRVDPVLAARVYLSMRPQLASPESLKIVNTLRGELDSVRSHHERSAIIAALGDLGWRLPGPRDGRGRGLCVVPAADWQLGLRSQAPSTSPRGSGLLRGSSSEFRTVELATFKICRFPVSNDEFARFVNDNGYNEKSLWTPEGWEWRVRSRTVEQFVAEWGRRRDYLRRHPERIIELLRSRRAGPPVAAALTRFAKLQDAEIAEHARGLQARPVMAPKYWTKRTLRNPLQPVVGVSWFEANAYCEWLSKQLSATVRLPSESEWEAACLHSFGITESAYADESLSGIFGNTAERGYPATTPIGTFATPDQTANLRPVDLLGNIFEWVFDHYAPGDHNRRILKGGSWRHESWRAHPAYRGRGDVDAQNDDVGFRYVVVEDEL